MLADINQVYLFVNGILNKNQSGSISPDDFSRFLNVAQQQYFRTKLGLPELYTVEKRQAPQEVQATQVIDDSMRVFFKATPLVNGGGGAFALPSDFAAGAPSGFIFTVQNPDGSVSTSQQPIDFVSVGEYWDRLQDYIAKPTYQYPIGTWLNGFFQVSPNDIAQIEFIYYRYPVTPVFAFTLNTNDQVVYNAGASVQLEFPNLDWENIAWICIDYCANFLREEFIKQSAGKRITTGMS